MSTTKMFKQIGVIAILTVGFLSNVQAQVKVGTDPVTIDPSAQFQVDATNKGVLVPRVALQSETDATTITSPAKGLMVFSTGGALPEGFYVNFGTSASPQWQTFLRRESNNWTLNDTYDMTASNAVDIPFSSNGVFSGPLGLSLTVTIPPFKQAKVMVDYSTPAGFGFSDYTSGGYLGVTFRRNGTEAQGGSRKVSLPAGGTAAAGGAGVRMSTIAGTFIETLTNNTANPITITYTLSGYVEIGVVGPASSARFNMFSSNPNDANFNWGRGTIRGVLYTKDI